MTAIQFAGMPTSAESRVLLALVAVYTRDGRATMRGVARAAGLATVSTAYCHLCALRNLGYVTWDSRVPGSLRPLVAPVIVRRPAA